MRRRFIIFLLFVQTDFKTSRIINRLSKACFTAYLLHPWIIKLVPFESIMKLPSAAMAAVLRTGGNGKLFNADGFDPGSEKAAAVFRKFPGCA